MGKYMWRKYIRVVAGLIPLAQRARGYFWIQCCRATAGTIGHGGRPEFARSCFRQALSNPFP